MTLGSGNAGNVGLTAGALVIDGDNSAALTGLSSNAQAGSTGNAGRVSAQIAGATTISDGGSLSSATLGSGAAGDVALMTGSLTIDGAHSAFLTGLSSAAESGSRGSAGQVSVTTPVSGTIQLLNGGKISSEAFFGSSGQPGTISIDAGTLILGANSQISIENGASVAAPGSIQPTAINIQARTIELNGGLITAASSGNVSASGIDINYAQLLRLDSGSVSTSANQGDGGAISIDGQGPLWLDHSNITTSVSGVSGNGGDIHIGVPVIVLNTGAIQANTVAKNGIGGNVTIDAQALIPSYDAFTLGGALLPFDPTTEGLNLVQAAAPQGLSGATDLSVPILDLG